MSGVLAMGGYAAFVWGAFGLTVAVMVLVVWQASRAHARTLKTLQSRQAAMESKQ